jgi:2-keto-4-pentenoate hydratase/2-oxohepta-3-ene-1,7-dioic acid hydratase in catechol pathway
VIGKRCKNVAPDSYLDVVAAYTIMNDVNMRDIPDEGDEAQHHADGQAPRHDGADWPYLVTRDEVAGHRISRYRRSSTANAANSPKGPSDI